MKNTVLHFPANYSALTEHELSGTYGGSLVGNTWNIITGTVTGLASAAAGVVGSVMRGEISPLDAICSSFNYLAGNVVASIFWLIMQKNALLH